MKYNAIVVIHQKGSTDRTVVRAVLSQHGAICNGPDIIKFPLAEKQEDEVRAACRVAGEYEEVKVVIGPDTFKCLAVGTTPMRATTLLDSVMEILAEMGNLPTEPGDADDIPF